MPVRVKEITSCGRGVPGLLTSHQADISDVSSGRSPSTRVMSSWESFWSADRVIAGSACESHYITSCTSNNVTCLAIGSGFDSFGAAVWVDGSVTACGTSNIAFGHRSSCLRL